MSVQRLNAHAVRHGQPPVGLKPPGQAPNEPLRALEMRKRVIDHAAIAQALDGYFLNVAADDLDPRIVHF